MKGGIYSDERCQICGAGFIDDGRTGLYCPNHQQCRATRCRVIFGKLCKRFKSYEAAYRFLNGVRFKTDEETFDERDYRKDNPLGFKNMASRWLSYKKVEVRAGSYKNIRRHIELASGYFDAMNVKEIKYGHIEDFLRTITLSGKSKHNIISTLHGFFVWMKRRQEIKGLPEFPSVDFELGYRKTIGKATQQAIIEEVRRICGNEKVSLGVRFLATYISIRPKELLSLKEGDIDLQNGYLYFPKPKEKKFKAVPLIQSDIEILKSFPISFPSMPFFRHNGGIQGTAVNQAFGEKYLYKWWVKACKNMGIVGVDLYGGTRHSSVRALRGKHSPEEIKEAAMSATNRAFERYMGRPEDSDIRSLYQEAGEVIPIDKGLTRRKTG